ncbi:hypothetical protein BT69DRAFT_1352557 [Atractiella rhizophila]|nr:hypothetical protein BT69DRAFT_1352557 [Atractiella rhizophila]
MQRIEHEATEFIFSHGDADKNTSTALAVCFIRFKDQLDDAKWSANELVLLSRPIPDSFNSNFDEKLTKLVEPCQKVISIPLAGSSHPVSGVSFNGTIGLFTVGTASMPVLPVELWDVTFQQAHGGVQLNYWPKEFSSYVLVCRLWRERLMSMSYEFDAAYRKLEFLKRTPVFQTRWHKLTYLDSDLENKVSLDTLISNVRIYQLTVTDLTLVYPKIGERSLLLELAHLNRIKRLELIGWDEFTVIHFLLSSRSRPKFLNIDLGHLHTSLGAAITPEHELEPMKLSSDVEA